MHLKIRLQADEPSFFIDGLDVSKHVLLQGFEVVTDGAGKPTVHIRMRPDSVDLDGLLLSAEAGGVEGVVANGGALTRQLRRAQIRRARKNR